VCSGLCKKQVNIKKEIITMYNKITLMGRITHDLEPKVTPSGVSVLSFQIAVDRSYQVKGEDRKADFFNIVAWRSTADFITKYFGKGRMIMLDGELQTRQYTDKNNAPQSITEIIADSVHFTGEKAQTQAQHAPMPVPPAYMADAAPAAIVAAPVVETTAPAADEIPFDTAAPAAAPATVQVVAVTPIVPATQAV
jgi:single-strand DNA-binding protein